MHVWGFLNEKKGNVPALLQISGLQPFFDTQTGFTYIYFDI